MLSLEGYRTWLSSVHDFKNIEKLVLNDLPAFIIGDKIGLAHQEPIKTDPLFVIKYLHLFVGEGLISNSQINESLNHIDVSIKENVWLVMLYIEAQKSMEQSGYHIVKIDVPMLERMLNEKADPAMKDDYTVKYIRNETKEKYGYEIKF